MAFELKPGQGTLFVNKRKEKPNQPDMTGELMLQDGATKLRVAGWKKTTKSGDEMLSLSVQPFEARAEKKADTDSDIPF